MTEYTFGETKVRIDERYVMHGAELEKLLEKLQMKRSRPESNDLLKKD